MARLFVYGTLKPVARERGGRPAHVWGRMWENGSHPAIRLTKPGDGYRIAGLVFEVADDDLAEFDRIEGVVRCWYRRARVMTVEGETVWVYEGARYPDDPDRWRERVPGEDHAVAWQQ
ncbi:MAG: gamma-glutamylcyclotransferase [Armatimonadetes bacterium]|nr:gamma-glutamylcyclotransferase [Armatimonadota bacterium]